ncbi:MAG: hypothetical protein IJW16_06130 [Clostridia bacterium]|nr:hypothetical protein [Clostridia bacterium]
MKNKVRVLALIMTLAIVLSSLVIVVPVSAEEPVQLKELVTETDGRPWTDFAGWIKDENGNYTGEVSGFAGGMGTKENPYQIATAEQLALLAYFMSYPAGEANYSRFNTKYYVLTADIDLAGHEWVAISHRSGTSPDMRFKGHFDGQGYTIKNMTVSPKTRADWTLDPEAPENADKLGITTGHQQTGLFGYLGGGATVGNFTLTGSIHLNKFTSGGSKIGLVVGEVSGSSVIHDVDAYGDILVHTTVGEASIGGIMGRANNAVINNCVMNGSIVVYSGTAEKGVIPCVGGIVSQASAALSITGCVNNASVTAYGNGTNSIVAGIVGKAGQTSNNQNADPVTFGTFITDTVNNGTVTIGVIPGGTSPNNQRIGGIMGNIGRGSGNSASNTGDYHMVNVELVRCANTGKVVLGAGIKYGGASGYCGLVGLVETQNVYKRGDDHVTLLDKNGNKVTDKSQAAIVSTPCPFKVEDCFVYYDASTMVLPHLNSSGATVNGVKIFGYANVEGCDLFFSAAADVSGKNANVRFGRSAVDALLAAGYTLDITYGTYKATVKSAEELATLAIDDGMSYSIKTKTQAGATPTVSLSRTFLKGTDLEATYTVTAREATWSDFYVEEYFPLNSADDAPAAGTAENPYVIYTAGQLGQLSADIAAFKKIGNASFILAADIDLSAHEWQPIGLAQPAATNGNYAPAITLLGYGHSIKNVRLTQDAYNYSQSFIGYSTWNISNLTFDGIEIRTPEVYPSNGNVDGVAGVIGAMYGGKLENVHVKSLDLDYEVNDKSGNDLYFGGLVGYLNGGTIDYCSVDGEINVVSTVSGLTKVGGFAARGKIGTITNSENKATVNVTVDNADNADNTGVGGFVGVLQCDDSTNSVTIRYCFNSGNVTLNYSNKGGNVGAAGFVGITNSKNGSLVIRDSMNIGKVAVNLVAGEAASNAKAASAIAYYGSSSLTVRDCISMTSDPFIASQKSGSSLSPRNCINSDLGIDIADQAGLRLNVTKAEESGMAFRATFDQDAYKELVDAGYAVSFGLVIAPTASFVAANGDVAALKGPKVVIDCDSVVSNGTFAGAVVNLDPKYLETNLSAVASITVSKLDDAGDATMSGTVYSAFEDNAIENNILALADYVINDLRSDAKTDVYCNLTAEGDYSPYTMAVLENLKNIYFPAK